ncbi:MAG TPA: ISL3 family transposase [Nitrospiraceae bacterium]|jgi:transposase|nr:ISL3 family transposase [Nitrospiraceae bacterium]
MLIKTILNKGEKFKSFVYGKVTMEEVEGKEALVVEVHPRKNAKGICVKCGRRCSTYDTQLSRLFEYLPLWGIQVFLKYAPRRTDCRKDGVHVELLPWSEGKEHMTKTYMVFLSRWAKRISWKETAEVFMTSWDSVFRAVNYVVQYGLKHRNLDQIEQIGVDELQVFRGQKFLTMVYQIDKGCRRLLWSGPERKAKTLLKFFREFGPERSGLLKYVCSDMWAPYLKVIKKKARNALNILDRFHIMKKFNEAIDEVRREEVRELKETGQEAILINGRWILLKRTAHLTERQVVRLKELLKTNLTSIKAYLMREDFQRFWTYHMPAWADKFLEDWANRTMHSNVEPMKKVAKMLRSHKELILNWFRAERGLSSGIVEGLNNKAKLTIRKAYGYRTMKHLQIALYHTLGDLPEPKTTHRFCG